MKGISVFWASISRCKYFYLFIQMGNGKSRGGGLKYIKVDIYLKQEYPAQIRGRVQTFGSSFLYSIDSRGDI